MLKLLKLPTLRRIKRRARLREPSRINDLGRFVNARAGTVTAKATGTTRVSPIRSHYWEMVTGCAPWLDQ
jgi:hypothetical protein